ncbi:MAG: translocation/assembly module TamB domain-containing protein [Alphaproteobacteria bacterium]
MTTARQTFSVMPKGLKIAMSVVAVLAALVVVAFLVIRSPLGHRMTAEFLEDLLSDEQTGMVVEIDGLTGNPLGTFAVDTITVTENGTQTVIAKSIEADWRPTGLLSGTVTVDRLTAGSVTINDAPDQVSPPADLIPDLPVDLAIQDIAIKTLRLPGSDTAFTLRGKAVLDRDGPVDLQAKMTPVSGAGEQLELVAIYNPQDESLEINTTLTTQEGGPLARVLLPDGYGGAIVTVTGTGPISDWQGRLRASKGSTQLIDLKLAITQPVLTISGTLDPQSLLDQQIDGLAAEPLDLKADIMFADGVPQSYRADLNNRAIHAELAGSLETVEALTAPRFDIRIDDLTQITGPVDGWTFGAIALRGDLLQDGSTGTAVTLSAADIRSDDVEIREFSGEAIVRLRDAAGDQGPTITLRGSGTIDPGKPFETDDQGRWSLDAAYDTDNTKISVKTLTLDALDSQLSGSADIALEPLALQADIALKADDLSPWDNLFDTGLAGAIEATAEIVWSDIPADRRLEITAQGKNLSYGDLPLGPGLGAAPSSSLRVVPTEDNARYAVDGKIDGVALAASLSGHISQDLSALDLNLDATAQPGAADALDALELGAPLSVSAVIQGPADGPSAALKLQSEQLTAGGLTLARTSVDATLEDITNAPRGRLDLAAAVQGEQINGGADLTSQTNGAWQLNDIVLTGPSSTIRGQVSAAARGEPVTGDLTLKARRSAILEGLTGTPAMADTTAAVSLSDQNGNQHVQFEIDAEDIEVWLPNRRRFTGVSATLDGSVTISDETVFEGVTLRAEDIVSGDLALDVLTATIAPEGDGLAIKAAVDGTFAGPLDLTLSAGLESAGLSAPNRLTLTNLDGTITGKNLTLAAPATITFEPGRTYAEPLTLRYGEGSVEAAFDYGDQQKTLRLNADGLDMGLISLFATGEDVFGTLDLTLDADLAGAPTGRLSVSVNDLLIGDELLQDPIDVKVDAGFEAGTLNATASITTAERLKLEAIALLSATLDPEEFAVDVDPDAPVSLTVSGRAELDDLWPLAGAYDHVLGGTAAVDFDLSGTIENPVLAGTFAIASATYHNLSSGFRMQTDRMAFSLKDGLLQLEDTVASDGGSGVIRLGGWVRPFSPEGVEADMKAELDKAKLVRLRQVTLTASGDVRYQRNEQGEQITGTAQINEAEVALIESLPPNIVELDVIEINRPVGLVTLPDTPDEQLVSPRIDAQITARNQVFVRGRGLESEWEGDVTVLGTLAKPRLRGRLDLLRGDFQFAGKRFELEDGSVDFTGGRTIDPILTLTAIYDVDTLTAELRLSGPISEPKIQLTSRPALPEDEILSRIMFGTDKNQLSALQAAQLAAAAASMAGSGGGFDAVGRIRQALSLERLEIGTRGEEGTSPLIRGGKYLTRNIYVEVGTARDEDDATSASVDVDLTKHLSVGTEATSTGNQKLRLRWKWDY